MHTRCEIEEFLTARDAQSELVREYAESIYEYQRREAKALPIAGVVEIVLVDADRCDHAADQAPDSLAYWYLARDVVECALRDYLPKIENETEGARNKGGNK